MNAPLSQVRIVRLHLPLGAGRTQKLEVIETEGMTLLGAMRQVRGTLPPTWLDSFSCHAGACNTCSILIGSTPGVPCNALVRDLGEDICLAPGKHFRGWDALRDDARKVHG